MRIFSFLFPVVLFSLIAFTTLGFIDDPSAARLFFYGSIIFIQSGLLIIAHNSATKISTKS